MSGWQTWKFPLHPPTNYFTPSFIDVKCHKELRATTHDQQRGVILQPVDMTNILFYFI